MKIIPISETRYTNLDFQIFDILPQNWMHRNEFSLYKDKERPLSALFFIFTDVEVTFFSENTPPLVVKKGDIVFIPKGMRYSVRLTNKNEFKIDTCTINLNMFDENREEIFFSDNISVLTKRGDNLLDVHLKNLFDVFYRVEKMGEKEAKNISRIKGEFFLILDLISESASQRSDFYYPIRRGVEAFSNEWNLNEKIEKYAEPSGMSETYFYRCFRKWSGISPVEYRNNLRLSNAESLLRCTDMKIGEISESVGFEDPFYFCKLFSEKYGASPRNYRNNTRG